ncbi:MAG: pyridoxal phosphate-dependent aminotransferase [Candidatus Coatesbacteria bacterium]
MSLSSRAAELRPSPTLAIEAKAKAMRAAGVDVVSLSAGEPDFDTPEHIKAAAAAAIKAGFTKYTPASGIPELKAAVAKHVKASQGLEYEPKQVVIGCGAKHVIANAITALVDVHDEVLIPAPFWVSYPAMVRLAGGTPRIVYADGETRIWNPDEAYLTPVAAGYKLNPASLAKGLNAKTKMVILNAPSNPTGIVYTPAELEGLAAVLREFPKTWILSDEIYDCLVYAGEAKSIAAVAPDLKGRVLLVNGVSKTFAMTGWRIGWALGSEHVIGAIGNLQSQTTSNPTSIAQKAALAALEGPKDSVAAMFAEFKKRRLLIAEGLSKIPGFRVAPADGAFYAFPDVRGLFENPSVASKLGFKPGQPPKGFSSALASHFLESAKVAMVPGGEFGLECHLRLSFATSADNITKAVSRMSESVSGLMKA